MSMRPVIDDEPDRHGSGSKPTSSIPSVFLGKKLSALYSAK